MALHYLTMIRLGVARAAARTSRPA